jgi:hypothetical protein
MMASFIVTLGRTLGISLICTRLMHRYAFRANLIAGFIFGVGERTHGKIGGELRT